MILAFERPALGANVGLGMLYDARIDSFLSDSALSRAQEHNDTHVDWQRGTTAVLCDSDNITKKFRILNLSPPQAASYLAGFVKHEGSGMFLAPSKPASGEEIVYHALHFTTSTVREQLNLATVDIQNDLAPVSAEATHVVSQILFGGSCNIIATGSIADPSRRADMHQKFAEASRLLQSSQQYGITLPTLLHVVDLVMDPQLSLTCFSDLPFAGRGRTSTIQIKQHLETMFATTTDAGYESARPVSYTLLPIHEL
jgi:hypothetical protein